MAATISLVMNVLYQFLEEIDSINRKIINFQLEQKEAQMKKLFLFLLGPVCLSCFLLREPKPIVIEVQPVMRTEAQIFITTPSYGLLAAFEGTPEEIADFVTRVSGYRLPTPLEKTALTEYFDGDIESLRGVQCAYVANWNSPTFLDGNGKFWTGDKYDQGIFPILETCDGYVKTLLPEEDGEETRYRIIYFREKDLVRDIRDTIWYKFFQSSGLRSNCPELCKKPLPFLEDTTPLS